MTMMISMIAGTAFAAALAAGCASTSGVAPPDQPYDRANALAAPPTATARVTVLAVELEVTADGATVIGSSIVRAIRPSNAAQQDLLVRFLGSDGKSAFEYTITDPRLVEVERQGSSTLAKASTFVHVPLSVRPARLEMRPLPARQQVASKGASIDLLPIIKQACAAAKEAPECRSYQ